MAACILVAKNLGESIMLRYSTLTLIWSFLSSTEFRAIWCANFFVACQMLANFLSLTLLCWASIKGRVQWWKAKREGRLCQCDAFHLPPLFSVAIPAGRNSHLDSPCCLVRFGRAGQRAHCSRYNNVNWSGMLYIHSAQCVGALTPSQALSLCRLAYSCCVYCVRMTLWV